MLILRIRNLSLKIISNLPKVKGTGIWAGTRMVAVWVPMLCSALTLAWWFEHVFPNAYLE